MDEFEKYLKQYFKLYNIIITEKVSLEECILIEVKFTRSGFMNIVCPMNCEIISVDLQKKLITFSFFVDDEQKIKDRILQLTKLN